ncbi:MAG: zinc-dependent peptidase [Phycisphaeraceae bacterium]
MFGYFRNRRRQRLRDEPLPASWWAVIDRRVPLVAKMPDADRQELGGHVRVLLHEKSFEGCAGLEITDEIRLTIAAHAAVLLLHRDTGYYPTLRTILVYPSAYVANHKQQMPDGTIVEGDQVRLGESWHRGALVLAWDDVVQSAGNPGDGHNVTLHEFAHQLDGQATGMDGAPSLPSAARYREWARVLGGEYEQLVQTVHAGHRTLLDAYGATSPPEFFAVATEAFFEQPEALKREHAELYDELAGFYQQDPAGR